MLIANSAQSASRWDSHLSPDRAEDHSICNDIPSILGHRPFVEYAYPADRIGGMGDDGSAAPGGIDANRVACGCGIIIGDFSLGAHRSAGACACARTGSCSASALVAHGPDPARRRPMAAGSTGPSAQAAMCGGRQRPHSGRSRSERLFALRRCQRGEERHGALQLPGSRLGPHHHPRRNATICAGADAGHRQKCAV